MREIKVHLPGEMIWALPTGERTPEGHRIASLRNESIHGIPWDTRVEIDDSSPRPEVVGPADVIEKAKASVARMRDAAKS